MKTKDIVRGKKLYTGKANVLYEVVGYPFLVELESTDNISAQNGLKRSNVKGKGLTNNTISTILFKLFNENNIPTHFVCEGLNSCSKVIKKAKMIRLEVIGRFIAAGSFCKRYNVDKGTVFENMTFELSYKDDDLGDPFVSESAAAYGLKVVNDFEDINRIKDLTYQIGKIAQAFFAEFGLTLVDFKVEFGYDEETGTVILCDEFSPDTCRLWDKNGNSFDKDVFRNDTGDVEATYRRILEKIQSK